MCRIVIVAHRAQKINRFRPFGACSELKTAKKTPLAGCGLSYSAREVYTAKSFGYSGGSGAVIADQTNSGEFFVFKIKRFLRKSISPSSRILPSSTDKPLRSTDR